MFRIFARHASSQTAKIRSKKGGRNHADRHLMRKIWYYTKTSERVPSRLATFCHWPGFRLCAPARSVVASTSLRKQVQRRPAAWTTAWTRQARVARRYLVPWRMAGRCAQRLGRADVGRWLGVHRVCEGRATLGLGSVHVGQRQLVRSSVAAVFFGEVVSRRGFVRTGIVVSGLRMSVPALAPWSIPSQKSDSMECGRTALALVQDATRGLVHGKNRFTGNGTPGGSMGRAYTPTTKRRGNGSSNTDTGSFSLSAKLNGPNPRFR
jgi:hypothetical protein